MRATNSITFLVLLLFTSLNIIAQDYKDCEDAYYLCGESPFSIVTESGVGMIDDGVNTTCVIEEFNSTWFAWTISESGTLTFDLIPMAEFQDLDFIVFKLSAVDDCENKELIRCMASGESAGLPPEQNEVCNGSTGLLIGETDIEELPGCAPTDNNYLAPLETVQGDFYLLLVNDFSPTSSSFELSFGGDALIDCITLPTQDSKEEDFKFEINPSVTSGQIEIEVNNKHSNGGRILIHDLSGKEIYQIEEVTESIYHIDLSNLPNGIYVASLQKEQSVLTKRFVIAR